MLPARPISSVYSHLQSKHRRDGLSAHILVPGCRDNVRLGKEAWAGQEVEVSRASDAVLLAHIDLIFLGFLWVGRKYSALPVLISGRVR